MPTPSAAIRVLHVDDDPDLVALSRDALEAANDAFEVETATDAERALERFRNDDEGFDCVVTDYDMPDADGLWLTERLRSRHPELPVIIFTGKGSEEIASEALAAGVTDYLQKEGGTEQFAVLANRIVNAVEGHRAEREVERSRRHFRKLIEETLDVIAILDASGTWTYVSPAVETVLGYDPDAIEGRSDFRLIHPGDRDRVAATVERLLEEPGDRRRFQARVRTADGDWKHMDIAGQSLLDDPDIEGVLFHGNDVTERRRRESALSELHETTRALMAARSRDDVLDRAIQAAEVILDLDLASFHVADDGRLVPGTATAETEDILGEVPVLERDGSVAWEVFETGEPMVADDIRERDGVMNPDTPVRSEMLLPMGHHGLFIASSTAVAAFDETDVSLAKVLVANVEVALDSTDRERRLREGEEALAALNDATREFLAAGSTEAVIDDLVRTAEEVLELPLVAVWRYDEAADALLPTVYPDRPAVLDDPPTYRAGDGVSWAVFEAGETRLFPDLAEEDGLYNPDTAIRSEIIAPIGDHGVLNTGTTRPHAFDETDRNLIDILAKTAGAALDRVERETVLERLHAATRELVGADTREEIGARTAEAAREVLGYNRAVVRLLTDDRLVPIATTADVRDDVGARPIYRVGEGTAGRAFEGGELVVYDLEELADDGVDRGAARSLLCIPLGDHGVLSIADDAPDAFGDSARRLARVLAANADTALTRIEGERELARQNERLDEFADVVSHDLRNPLTVAASYVEELSRDVDDERLSEVERALDRMDDIIGDALDLARSGQAVGEVEPVPLDIVARAAWATAGDPEAELTLTEDLGLVRAHRGRLQQLLENLFRNAREHVGPDVSVRVGHTPDGFFVEDDGPGIHPADREAVFESGVTTAADGTGFGLAIVHRLASAHGWSVTVCEGRNGGARFEFEGIEFEG